jgi:hypothetical protein
MHENLWPVNNMICGIDVVRCRTTISIYIYIYIYILWHLYPLLGNDRETNNETTAVARQLPSRNNGSTGENGVFYVVRSEAKSRDRPN